MAKTIFRSVLTKHFTVLPNAMLRDKRLSFKARGLLAMVLSNSDEWVINKGWMESQSESDGEKSIDSALKELKKLGYVVFFRRSDGRGNISNVWEFYDTEGHSKPLKQDTFYVAPLLRRTYFTSDVKRRPSEVTSSSKVTLGTEEQERAGRSLPPEAETWNRERRALPLIFGVGKTRAKKLEARRAEPFWVANFEAAVKKAAASDFCNGKSERGWRASFDWLLQPDTVTRLMEGQYDNRKTSVKVKIAH
jgi:hypothetical protein